MTAGLFMFAEQFMRLRNSLIREKPNAFLRVHLIRLTAPEWSHMVAARRYSLPSAPCSTRASASLLLALRALGSAPPSRGRLLGRIPACVVISYRHATRVINLRLRVTEPKGFAPFRVEKLAPKVTDEGVSRGASRTSSSASYTSSNGSYTSSGISRTSTDKT